MGRIEQLGKIIVRNAHIDIEYPLPRFGHAMPWRGEFFAEGPVVVKVAEVCQFQTDDDDILFGEFMVVAVNPAEGGYTAVFGGIGSIARKRPEYLPDPEPRIDPGAWPESQPIPEMPLPKVVATLERNGAVLAQINVLDVTFSQGAVDADKPRQGRLSASGPSVMTVGEKYLVRHNDGRKGEIQADGIFQLPGGGFIAIFHWLEEPK